MKMGGLSEFNGAAVDAARKLKKLERRLKALVAQARRASRKVRSRETSGSSSTPEESPMASPSPTRRFPRFAPKSPLCHLRLAPDSPLLASSKRLLATLSNKAAPFLQRRKLVEEEDEEEEEEEKGGLWQREILMGEKCQPLDFSGVIYYDKHGKRVSGFSPRSPLRRSGGGRPMVQSFSFPVPLSEKEDF